MLKHKILFFLVFSVLIILDQISKWWTGRDGGTSYNTGISLGLFSVLPAQVLTLILVAIMALVGWLYRDEWRNSPVASGLFFGGGISNIIDRLVVGSVRDWLPVPYLSIYNNLADYGIAVGLLLILINSLHRNYHLEADSSENNAVHEETEEDL